MPHKFKNYEQWVAHLGTNTTNLKFQFGTLAWVSLFLFSCFIPAQQYWHILNHPSPAKRSGYSLIPSLKRRVSGDNVVSTDFCLFGWLFPLGMLRLKFTTFASMS